MPENVSVRPLSPSPPTHEARIGHVRSVLITATQKASLNPSPGAPRKPVGSPNPRKNPLSREARLATVHFGSLTMIGAAGARCELVALGFLAATMLVRGHVIAKPW
jgi:hypothetical protein